MSDNRRRFLSRSVSLTAAGLVLPSQLVGDELADESNRTGLIVRSRRPLDLETPVDKLDSEFTPNDWFFVRNHFGEPAVRPQGWQIAFDGSFVKPANLSLTDIFSRSPRYEIPAVAMCAGNGRALFAPKVPGLMWERGAVGQAVWSGIRFADLIRSIGLDTSARHIIFETADVPPSPKTPPYTRSIPLDRLMQDDVLLVDRMNGEPLPLLHGGPLRLVVPTWTANHWVKWIVRMTASADESPAFFQKNGYKINTIPIKPTETPKPDQLTSVTTLNVKSLVTSHLPGQTLRPGRHEVRGQAWTGPGVVEKVEIRVRPTDPWLPAEITTKTKSPGAWVRWKWNFEAQADEKLMIETRAIDSLGNAQPVEPFWNRSGYLFNAIDGVPIRIA
jgi:DMSO/TMAO reductase YedYZ molybdopterin-dependent catalytic subunit